MGKTTHVEPPLAPPSPTESDLAAFKIITEELQKLPPERRTRVIQAVCLLLEIYIPLP